MDPLVFVELAKSLLDLVNTAMKGQTPEQSAKLWQWYIDDMTFWRKFFKIPD